MKPLLTACPFVLVGVAWSLGCGDPPTVTAQDSNCITCHEKHNPGLVEQWKGSKHATTEKTNKATCEKCHGSAHRTDEDANLAKMPTAKTCMMCHVKEYRSFNKGKHALAELSVSAIPMFSQQPESIQKMGCGTCHSVGKRWDDGSVGKCDSCHTRHAFSVAEARRPEACETCHMGEDHSQYEMWRSSKHGVVHHLDPTSKRAPVCQDCHVQDGDHAVMTGWGFLGLRLPVQDEAWQEDTLTLVKAIGPWGRDEAGMAERVGAIKTLELARLDEETFQTAREKMITACAKCHSTRFGKEHLELADQVIKETTHLMAKAVRIVEALYDDGVLPRTEDGPKHVDLLLFYDSPTEIEQELYKMFLFHRQKAFQGAIHANPDYMHWYGWAPMKTSFQRIEALALELRAQHAKGNK